METEDSTVRDARAIASNVGALIILVALVAIFAAASFALLLFAFSIAASRAAQFAHEGTAGVLRLTAASAAIVTIGSVAFIFFGAELENVVSQTVTVLVTLSAVYIGEGLRVLWAERLQVPSSY